MKIPKQSIGASWVTHNHRSGRPAALSASAVGLFALPNWLRYHDCVNHQPEGANAISWARFCTCLWIEDQPMLSCLGELLSDMRAV